MAPNGLAVPLVKRITRHRAFIPVTVFVVLVVVLLISARLTDHPPVVAAITPQIGSPGSILLIKGHYFGTKRGNSNVIIAGVRPSSSDYLAWSNTRISVRIPRQVDSGMVYVRRSNGRSNGKLFTNKSNIPVVVKTTSAPGQPHISSISPTTGGIGSKLTIVGKNFGKKRGSGKVLFAPISVSDQGLRVAQVGPKERFAGCDCSFMYSSWSNTKIVLYVPDGASSGNITVVTHRGTSNAQYFEVSSQVGTTTYRDKRGYQIHFGAQLSNVSTNRGGTIDLWLPDLSPTLAQRHIERIVEPKPTAGAPKGMMRFSFAKLEPKSSYSVNVTYYFDRYAMRTQINPTKVVDSYDTSRSFYKAYTAPGTLVPSTNTSVDKTAQKIVGSHKSPYTKARLLYQFVTQKMKYARGQGTGGALATLKSGSGDSYSLSLLYTALLRAVGIPARPVAGVLVYGNKQTVDHYWAEFYLPDFGWVPTDPALGAGAKYDGFPTRSDAADYYFGNLDNQHITFTRGVVRVQKLAKAGKTVHRPHSYSLQTISEEASPQVKGYDSVWDDVRVVDWW